MQHDSVDQLFSEFLHRSTAEAAARLRQKPLDMQTAGYLTQVRRQRSIEVNQQTDDEQQSAQTWFEQQQIRYSTVASEGAEQELWEAASAAQAEIVEDGSVEQDRWDALTLRMKSATAGLQQLSSVEQQGWYGPEVHSESLALGRKELCTVEQILLDGPTLRMESSPVAGRRDSSFIQQQFSSNPALSMEKVVFPLQRQSAALPAKVLPQVAHASIGLATPLAPAALPSRHGIRATLLPWFYRAWLIGATVLLSLLLLGLQGGLDHIRTHTSVLQSSIQWGELTWLGPVPLAVILWLGWFIFAEAARPDPVPVEVPKVVVRQGLFMLAPAKPVRLVFRFVTRGDNVEVLRDSVIAVHRAFARYPLSAGPYQIEIISECAVALNMGVDERTHIYVVPSGYVTEQRSRFKARALTYLQQQTRPQREDWYIYLDEESLIDEMLLAGLYRFIWRAIKASTEEDAGKKRHVAGLIGQGAILYQGGNWFFRGADALRTADDLGRFRLQYALGLPMFGVHGSYIVIRGADDTRLSFDVGTANSITEDAAWALRAWAKGFRFAWVDGYLHEQPPQRIRDFVRQRSRWLSGIRAVLRDKQTPLPYRLCLGVLTGLWQLAFLPFLVAVVALFVHASPFVWMRVPADFAWATFILAYFQGIDVQAKHSHPFVQRHRGEKQWKRVVSWLLVFCSIWYSLLEAAGVLYSLKPRQGFFVIQKPSLAAENKVAPREHTQGRTAYQQHVVATVAKGPSAQQQTGTKAVRGRNT